MFHDISPMSRFAVKRKHRGVGPIAAPTNKSGQLVTQIRSLKSVVGSGEPGRLQLGRKMTVRFQATSITEQSFHYWPKKGPIAFVFRANLLDWPRIWPDLSNFLLVDALLQNARAVCEIGMP